MDECRTRINADGDAECFRNLLLGRARVFRLGSVRGDAPDATQADRDSQRDQLALTAYGAELPMQLQANYAGSCPIADIQRRHPDGVDGWKLG